MVGSFGCGNDWWVNFLVEIGLNKTINVMVMMIEGTLREVDGLIIYLRHPSNG
jgi:hypothetical protein